MTMDPGTGAVSDDGRRASQTATARRTAPATMAIDFRPTMAPLMGTPTLPCLPSTFYADGCLSSPLAIASATGAPRPGVDVVAVVEMGWAGHLDDEILAASVRMRRFVLGCARGAIRTRTRNRPPAGGRPRSCGASRRQPPQLRRACEGDGSPHRLLHDNGCPGTALETEGGSPQPGPPRVEREYRGEPLEGL